LWQFNKGLAIDVAVICPVAPCHMNQEVPCEYYAATQKHDRYDPGFVDSRYDFAAMVFETSGAVNLESSSRSFALRASASALGTRSMLVVHGPV